MPKRALISVSDKRDLGPFARRLSQCGFEIISTGGTARALRQEGVGVIDVSEVTGFPEIFEGRVKTLHPAIHGGLLARRDHAGDRQEAEKNSIGMIDLVVVNLYPFRETVARPGVTQDEAIENIDVGGPAMIRAAAKNFEFVSVVTDPGDYNWVAESLERSGQIERDQRLHLARKAFASTADYDAHIASYLFRPEGGGQDASAPAFPAMLSVQADKVMDLRYGENPHQRGALYRLKGSEPLRTVATAEQLQGKELSFNNYLDLESAWRMVRELDQPACAIIKHNNPSGAAEAATSVEAYRRALSTDSVSAFGSVIGFNREVDPETAAEVSKLFVEAIIAPGFSGEALRRFGEKKNLRLMRIDPAEGGFPWEIKSIQGGLLLQDWDRYYISEKDLKVMSRRAPTREEIADLLFAWKICKHVKSNAIVFASGATTLGVGAGQMSRVDSVRIATQKACSSLKGAVMASDAFFPFRDGLDEAAKAGIAAVIEPGGSMRDQEVIDAADEHGMALVFTGIRHFRH